MVKVMASYLNSGTAKRRRKADAAQVARALQAAEATGVAMCPRTGYLLTGTTSGEGQLITSITPLANEAALCAWCHEVRQPCDATLSASLENGDHVWLCTTCFEQQVMSDDEEMPSIDGGPEDSDDDCFARNINPISSAAAAEDCYNETMAGSTPNRAASSNRPSGPAAPLTKSAATDVVRKKPPPPCPAMDRCRTQVVPQSLFGSPPPKGPPPAVEKAAIIGGSLTGPPPPQRQRDSPRAGYAFINGVETYLNTPAVGWMNHYCRVAVQLSKFPAPRTTLEAEYQIAVKSSVKMPPPRTHMEADMQVAVKMGGQAARLQAPSAKTAPRALMSQRAGQRGSSKCDLESQRTSRRPRPLACTYLEFGELIRINPA